MKPRLGLPMIMALAAGFPAVAEECRSAPALERQLFETPVQPFVANVEPTMSNPSWNVGTSGGFQMAAPGLGEVTTLFGAMAEATTSCSLRVTWALRWDGGHAVSAGLFRVVAIETKPEPRRTTTFGNTTFRITPDTASQTAWLTVREGGHEDSYLLDFPATAISMLPNLHSAGVRIEVMGRRDDGALVYAELNAAPKR